MTTKRTNRPINAHALRGEDTETADGYTMLACDMILQAVADLADPDPLVSLDALDFWLDPGGGAAWMDLLGIRVADDPDKLFEVVCRSSKNGREKFRHIYQRRNRKHEPR